MSNPVRNIKFAAFITTLLLAALACNFSFSSANVDEAWMARDEAGDERTTSFNQNDDFYALVKLANAPDDTALKATWYTVSAEDTDADTQIAEFETSGGDATYPFKLSNINPWPVGKYKVEINLNDELDTTLEFEVVASEAPTPEPQSTTAPSAARIGDSYMASDPDGAQPNTVFRPEETFYNIVQLADAPADTRLKAVWYVVSAEGMAPNSVLDQAEISGGSGQYYFELTNQSPWTAGSYKVEIYLNDVLDRTLEFQVGAGGSAAPAPGGNYVSDSYMSVDPDGVTPTTIYSPNAVFYNISDVSNAANDTVLRAEWYTINAAGITPNSIIDTVETTGGNGIYTFDLSSQDPWPAGTYRVEIYVNGALDALVEFSVQ